MKKKNNQKKKSKRKSLILLLFLTIIMFGTSTYAWFTANTQVTINSIDVNVASTGGIQISTNAANWKSVVTTADITSGAYDNNVNQLPADMGAVSTDGTVANGRLKMYRSIVGNTASEGAYSIQTKLETDAKGTTGNYVAFDVFLKVDEDKLVYLTNASHVDNTDDTDKGLKNSARVAFVTLGNVASTAQVSDMTSLNTATPPVIWEPNCDAHAGIATQATEFGVTLNDANSATGTSDATTYYGVNQEIPETVTVESVTQGVPLKDVVKTGKFNGTIYATKMQTNSGGITLLRTPVAYSAATTYQQLLSLKAGVTKVRIYMWVEGQDIDCENSASGSKIQFNLQLSTLSSAS